MEEIIGKPIDPSASGGAVANSPPKPTIPPIRQRILGPFSRYPAVNRPVSRLATKPTVPTRPLVRQKIVGPVSRYPAVNERISRPTLNSVSSIEAELAEVRSAWARYRSTNSRDAVYIYLASVFAVVTRWRRLNCAVKNSRAALRLQAGAAADEARAIRNRDILHGRSERSRTPRPEANGPACCGMQLGAKPAGQRLTDFIKSNGGINECAHQVCPRVE